MYFNLLHDLNLAEEIYFKFSRIMLTLKTTKAHKDTILQALEQVKTKSSNVN